jgi:hypothetical protein
MLPSIRNNIKMTGIITDFDKPICRDCIYYKPSIPFEYDSSMSKCGYFGKKDIISGKIDYDYVDISRNDDNKCGKIGKYFEQEKNIELKYVKYFILNKYPIIIFFNVLLIVLFNYKI